MRKLSIWMVAVVMSAVSSVSALAAEVKQQPITQAELRALSAFSGEQLKGLLAGNEVAITQAAEKAGIDRAQLEQSLAQLSTADQEALSSASAKTIDAIVAGELDGATILVSALATLGILLIIAAAAA